MCVGVGCKPVIVVVRWKGGSCSSFDIIGAVERLMVDEKGKNCLIENPRRIRRVCTHMAKEHSPKCRVCQLGASNAGEDDRLVLHTFLVGQAAAGVID